MSLLHASSPTIQAGRTHADYAGDLVELALRGLPGMYRPDRQRFAFRIRRTPGGVVQEGESLRYTAIALLGLAEYPQRARAALRGDAPEEVCGRLLDELPHSDNLGDAALTLWAARRWAHPRQAQAAERVAALAGAGDPFTVELAWVVTALSDPNSNVTDLGRHAAERLMAAAAPTGAFPHRLGAVGGWRGHVACFADLIYPIQALAHYHAATGDARALQLAERNAELICRRQGDAGQWWWHYDVRTGDVIEPYPVYAVHQDAMGPMGLFALEEAGGRNWQAATARGLDWLRSAPELNGGTLVDARQGIVWRKVARHEFRKLARRVQAAASGVHPRLRVPGLSQLLPPGAVDYESRPYHLGWILHAFSPARRAAFRPEGAA